jgi:hypothetical protein
MRRAASAAPSACCSNAASTQSPKACRPFSGAAGPVISTTAVPSSAGTLTRSEMRPSSVLNSSSGPHYASPLASTEPIAQRQVWALGPRPGCGLLMIAELLPGCSQEPYRRFLPIGPFRTFIQTILRGAGGARTHDRRIMRTTATCTVRTTCTDTTSRAADGSYCTVRADGSVHESVHAFHGDHRMPATERYRRPRGSML